MRVTHFVPVLLIVSLLLASSASAAPKRKKTRKKRPVAMALPGASAAGAVQTAPRGTQLAAPAVGLGLGNIASQINSIIGQQHLR